MEFYVFFNLLDGKLNLNTLVDIVDFQLLNDNLFQCKNQILYLSLLDIIVNDYLLF